MGCNDYNLHLDGSSGEQPTPEYNIYLDGVGVNGYSPTVDFVNKTSETFRIQVNDINGTKLSDTIPLSSYIQGQLYAINNTLEGLDTTYLQVDGSNANISFTVNGIQLQGANGTGEGIRISRGTSYNSIYSPSFSGGDDKDFEINYGLDGYLSFKNSLGYACLQYKGATLTLEDNKLYYGDNSASNEIATIGDIPSVGNGTITLTQGGVTKGTFTTNQSGNTTIDLDAGGGTITNPLHIGYTNNNINYNLNLGVDETTSKVISSYIINTEGSTLPPYIAPIKLLTESSNPLVLTENQDGLYNLSLNIDDTTIKVNQDGELYAVGGGGGSYTAGTGIDITGGVISVEDTQEFDTVTLANTISNSGEGLYGTTADGSSTLPLVRIDSLDGVLIGNTTSDLYLFGDNTRPYYNNSTNTLALSSDIPDVSNFLEASDITTGSTNGTIAVGSTDIAVKGLGSAAYTPTTDYMTVAGNQTGTDKYITGNKQFHGTVYLTAGKVIIQNDNNTQNIGLINNVSDLQISTYSNKNIKFSPNGTGKLYYGNNEVATVNNIPTTMTGATSSTAGTAGLVPAPAAGDESKVLQGDGTWVTPSSGGLQNTATGTDSLTILGTPASDSYSVNIGNNSNASNSYSVAIGNGATTISQYSVAIGNGAKAGDSSNTSYGSVCIGYNAGGEYTKSKTVSIGAAAQARSEGGIAIGDNAIVSTSNYQYNNGIAIGKNAVTQGSCAIQLGTGTNSTDCSLYVGFDNTDVGYSVQENWQLLDGITGLIPEARIGTFASPINSTAINPIINKLTSADITVAPSADIDTGIIFRDNNNINLAGFTTTRFANGIQSAQMTAINEVSGTQKSAYFNVYVDSNGNDMADGSTGVKNAIAQFSGHLGGAVNVAFDASGNFAPTTNGYLYVAIRTIGVGSIAYVSCNGLIISLGFDQANYVISGVLPVSVGYYAHIDYFNGAFFEAAKFVPLGGY